MNFKILHLAAALAVAALFSSCQHDEEVISNESYYQTISAEFVEPEDALQTRSCVDVRNPNTSFVGLLWQVADKLGVFTANGKENAEFSNNATANSPKAEFGGSLAGEAKYAYFPFSKSSGTNVTSLSGQVLSEQPFNLEDGTLVCDYKVGTRVEGTNTFKFEQILTMLRITIDASNTDLEGERLNKIVLTVTDKNGNARNISGDFTFNATNGDVTASATRAVSNVISMPWTTRPELSKGKSYQGFISLLPDVIKKDDILTIEVTSDAHRATFSLGCLEDLVKGFIYEIPLKLKELLDKYKDDGKADVEELTVPTITAFSFKVSDNSGKLLSSKLGWESKNPKVTSV
ncbi:MAG: fimbrillin family protein, partial [Bacteroidales bacterium]|nr:fimbrillin family protein [Bacteroidales bacterium]